jgi:hypothetical protein
VLFHTYAECGAWDPLSTVNSFDIGQTQEAKYVEGWPNMTSAWAGWSRFDIPVDRYGGVHSQLICTRVHWGFLPATG